MMLSAECPCAICSIRRQLGCKCCSCCCITGRAVPAESAPETLSDSESVAELAAITVSVSEPTISEVDSGAESLAPEDAENRDASDIGEPCRDAPDVNAAAESKTASEEAEVELSLGDGRKQIKGQILTVETFEALNMPVELAANVVRAGYDKPTVIQKYAMGPILYGKDVMGCSQTGSGKTAAYLLPIMSRLITDKDVARETEAACMPRVLILAPTRELAIQIFHEANRLSHGTVGCKAAILYGGTDVNAQKECVLKGAAILIGTVGRVRHFVRDGVVSLERTQHLVLDEADRLLEMGFKADIDAIMMTGRIKPMKERQTIMFSASFPAAVQDLARSMLGYEYLMIVADRMGASKTITQDFMQVTKNAKKSTLLELVGVDLKKREQDAELQIFKRKTLIFVGSKKMADALGVFLSESGVPTTTIHGDREQDQRESALDDFRSGRTPLLIATAVAERGLDISGLDHVINFDMPKDVVDYVHRIGRTGRVGRPGLSTSFIDPDQDKEMIGPLRDMLEEARQLVPEWLKKLEVGGVVDGIAFGDEDSSDKHWTNDGDAGDGW